MIPNSGIKQFWLLGHAPQSVVSGPTARASPGSLLGMQNLKPIPDLLQLSTPPADSHARWSLRSAPRVWRNREISLLIPPLPTSSILPLWFPTATLEIYYIDKLRNYTLNIYSHNEEINAIYPVAISKNKQHKWNTYCQDGLTCNSCWFGGKNEVCCMIIR